MTKATAMKSAEVHVLLLSHTSSNPSVPYALENRIGRMKDDLEGIGLVVTVLGPDGAAKSHETDLEGDGEERPRERKSRRPGTRHLPGPLMALMLLWHSLRFLRATTGRSGSSEVLLFFPGWMPLTGMALKALRPQTILHLDVPGIPHRENRIAAYRFWRFKARLFERLFQWSVANADILTTINETHARIVMQTCGRLPIVVRDLPRRDRLQNLLRIPAREDKSRATILFMGSISRGRLDPFLAACEQLLRCRDHMKVVVLGDGSDLARHRQEHSARAFAFKGYVPDSALIREIQEADVCYSDVWTEVGTPYKILEYMAAGKAIVTHKAPSTLELIVDKVDGMLCDPGEESIRKALGELLSNAELRATLGAQARAKLLTMVEPTWTTQVLTSYMQRISSHADA